MRWLFGLLILVHGLIHLMGFAKAFGFAQLTQLTRDISRPVGALWLLAALLQVASAGALILWPRGFWIIGASACVLSQTVIGLSWVDAKFGTVANVLLLLGVVLGFAAWGPLSFQASYRREVAERLRGATAMARVTEADLAHLPKAIQRYVRDAGAVGQPRVRSMRARFRGQIRSDASSPWMPFTAEQHNFYDDPARLFLMRATRASVPFDVLHRYVGSAATMRVKIASLFPMVDARGAEMNRAETVTMFNDMVLLAPGALIDPAIRWEEIDAHTVRARFTNAGNTIAADLIFDEAGALANFVSDDRLRSSADGRSFTRMRWSTPVHDYRAFGPHRIATRGEAVWHAPAGEYAYGRFELVDLAYNLDSL